MQTGSRQSWPRVCTRWCLLLVRSRHGVSVASLLQRKQLCRRISVRRQRRSRSETCIHVLLRHTGTLTQNITTIESEFPWCEASKQGCCRLHCWPQSASWTRGCHGPLLLKCKRKCRLLSTVTRLIYSLLDPAVKKTESIVATCCHNQCEDQGEWDGLLLYVGDAGNTSGRDRGRYPRECWLSTLGVLHPGVPVMWYVCPNQGPVPHS